jgi:C1A family cysteine protease
MIHLILLTIVLNLESTKQYFKVNADSNYIDFNDYKMKFNKKYLNLEDELKHKIVFNKRLKIINENNKNPNKLNTFGINKFTDRLDEELPKLGFKMNLNVSKQNEIKNVNLNLKGISTLNIPNSFWSCNEWTNLCGNIINQGDCGSCYAAAIANDAQIRYNYILKRMYLSKNTFTGKFAIQNLIDCGSDKGCDGGSSDLTLMNTRIILLEKDYPYEDFNTSCIDDECIEYVKECRYNDNMKPIMKVDGLTYFSNLDWETIKTLIYNKGSFITAMNADDLSYYDGSSIWSCDENIEEINHAVVVDGYGEEFINDKHIKYLWVRNSWGNDWGYNGHFRINFDNSCGINNKIKIDDSTYDIYNFVPDYIINDDIIDEIINENEDENESENSKIIIIIVSIIAAILVIFGIIAIIAIIILVVLLIKNRK